jgi:starch phosphorylase
MQEHYPDDIALLSRTSIIDESNDRRVRMAWLAVVVSHKVNGVSELHSRLMVESLFADFARIFPRRFTNVTNGVTPRRWLAAANPSLAAVLDRHIGQTWRTDLSQLSEMGNIRIIRWLTRPSAPPNWRINSVWPIISPVSWAWW